VAEGHEVTPLRGTCDNRRFARHDPHPEPNEEMESQAASVGHPAETCLGLPVQGREETQSTCRRR
jgi:hypothetical protein